MAKRRHRRQRRHARGGNTCCPVVRVKCGRKGFRHGPLGDVTPGFLKSAEQMLSDRFSAQKVARVVGHKVMCTIRVGGKTRRVNAVHVKSALKKIIAGQHRRRCIPKLNGKLIVGNRAGVFAR